LQELDYLLLQKIEALQDQLLTLLLKEQNSPVDVTVLTFLSNNSSFFVALTILNMFGKSDLEVLTDEIIKTQEISHDLHIAITKKALTTSSELFLNNVAKVITEVNSLSMLNSTQKLEVLFSKLTSIEKVNVEVILQKINELSLKTQTIDSQILQIFDLLSQN
jgi:hypothetical protein